MRQKRRIVAAIRFPHPAVAADVLEREEVSMSATTIQEGHWRELRARLGAFVGRRVGNPADAEDVVQDVFVRM